MKHKTSELEGGLLDAIVAKLLGQSAQIMAAIEQAAFAHLEGVRSPLIFFPGNYSHNGGDVL